MKKWLLCVLAMALLICLASCAKQTNPDIPSTGLPEAPLPPTEEPAGPKLEQVSIYNLGIRTELVISEENTTKLVGELLELLESAALADSMDTAPADSPNSIQVTARQTALELIYNQEIELPIQINGEPVVAQRLLYSDGGLLYVGKDIYGETPIGKIFDPSLQDAIYSSAADQVERVIFSAGGQQVTINGQDYAYKEGEDAAELPGMLLNRMLYRSIAFYLNAYTGNTDGLTPMCSSTLLGALNAAKMGSETDNTLGEETIIKLNQYILADYFLPQTIVAPVETKDGYTIYLILNEFATIEVQFVVQDDTPLINSLHLIMADAAAPEEEAESNS